MVFILFSDFMHHNMGIFIFHNWVHRFFPFMLSRWHHDDNIDVKNHCFQRHWIIRPSARSQLHYFSAFMVFQHVGPTSSKSLYNNAMVDLHRDVNHVWYIYSMEHLPDDAPASWYKNSQAVVAAARTDSQTLDIPSHFVQSLLSNYMANKTCILRNDFSFLYLLSQYINLPFSE